MDANTETARARRVLRMPQACEKTGLCRSTIYALMAQGRFPQAFPLIPGGRIVGWYEEAIDQYLEERAAAAGASLSRERAMAR